MFNEKGTLPLGVEHSGKVHKDFTLRPLKIGDSIASGKAQEDDVRLADPQVFGLWTLSRRLTIGEIPAEAMTVDLMLDMFKDDIDAVMDAEGRLAARLASFRGAAAAETETDAGSAQGGGAVGCGPGDA
ncbi:MAG: hypothetical protein OEV91_06520 [Desulfobulbaceae bacterium]|nr:hypothetical protein [Desulfobulbaceae bacterium]